MEAEKTLYHLERELEELRYQLDEANETIEAIRTGQIDALIVKDKSGHQLYTLKSADQTYRVFIEKMNEGALTLNKEGLILYSNSRFASMLGLPLSKVIGQSFDQFICKEDKNVFTSLIRKGWQTESKGEISLLCDGNKSLPILVSLTTLELDEGTALSIIVTDLSTQKETEKQLKLKNEQLLQAHNALAQLNNELEDRVEERTLELSLSREHFKFLADNIPVIVWTSKPNGEVDYFNKKWLEYTGCTPGEIDGYNWQKVIHPDDLQRTIEAWEHSIKTGSDYNIEYRFWRASDGTYRWHSGKALPFKNDDGEIVAWFGICTDIDDQKLAMVKKDEFISMASHELKTPVTTLKAFTQLVLSILQKEDNNKTADLVLRMDKQINKLTNLITDLLDASKVNAGEMYFEEAVFDFNELVIEIVDQMRLTAEKHTIELHLGESKKIFGDRNRLGQVIDNLISNAIKYSPQASGIIVRSTVFDTTTKLCVEDFGIGIPLEQQSKLFNRFFRASEVKSNTFPGLGLGLYISNEIIKRHSGKLTFTSEEGKGSVFCFEIPFINS